jgi:hypothetical protein
MEERFLEMLEQFIVRAKQATYVGNGQELLPYRLGSKDLQFKGGDFVYHDSYLGESDFIGQEIVYYRRQSVWGQNYFGWILQPSKITSAQAGKMIKKSLSQLYNEGRFLGGFEYRDNALHYVDTNAGNTLSFHGIEYIYLGEELVYKLAYHGGLLHSQE